MTVQPQNSGYTVEFLGVTEVTGGFEWSYRVTNDGSAKDLSHFLVELKHCPEPEPSGSLPCSLGECSWATEDCPLDSGECGTISGVKFDDLPSDMPVQTFSFLWPVQTGVTIGCCLLKFGLNRICLPIEVPDCSDDPPCPPCPEDSLREKRVIQTVTEIPDSLCPLNLESLQTEAYLCLAGVRLTKDKCPQEVEVVMCAGEPSEQRLTCPILLDFLLLDGELEIVWTLSAEWWSDCNEEPVRLSWTAVTRLKLYELCFFCEGERPDFNLSDVCQWFEVVFIGLDSDGTLTWSIQFDGC